MHAWLVMLKAFHAIAARARLCLEEAGLCDSDFRVLEVLLHKGPLPVNTIGPRVHLTPGSISIAVDRLHARGLVSRVAAPGDRRVRLVDLTPTGRAFILPVFGAHARAVSEIFEVLSADELARLEGLLKRVGLRAEALGGTR